MFGARDGSFETHSREFGIGENDVSGAKRPAECRRDVRALHAAAPRAERARGVLHRYVVVHGGQDLRGARAPPGNEPLRKVDDVGVTRAREKLRRHLVSVHALGNISHWSERDDLDLAG